MDIIVCELGRMGDIVSCEPIFRHLKEKYASSRLVWYTTEAFADILRHAPFIDETRIVRDASEYLEEKKKFPDDALVVELNFSSPGQKKKRAESKKKEPSNPYFDSLLNQFAYGAGLNGIPDETPVFHFSADSENEFKKLKLPEKYAVFHCASNGVSRQWQPWKFRSLASDVMAYGIPVVEIGFKSELKISDGTNSKMIFLTGGRPLQLLARVIEGSSLFVGVESGFGHIANAVGVPMLIVSGRLRSYSEYTTYSGRARAGIDCNIVRWYDEETDILPLEIVRTVLRRRLEGNPMREKECAEYCRISQIESLRHFLPFRIWRGLVGPFRSIKRAIRHHYLRK